MSRNLNLFIPLLWEPTVQSNFEFGYSNPNSARTEKGNADTGTVAGSYSYLDGHGLRQKIDYVADDYGHRVTAATNGAGVPIPVY